MSDKYKAVWLSHSSISDFLKCPRLYYLRNVYKDPKTGHKITITKPQLSMGMVIHEVIESLSELPVDQRFSIPLTEKLLVAWKNITGKLGGFTTSTEEKEYKDRALAMLARLTKNPGPLANKAIKIKSESGLPYYWLSGEDNLILCGKIDWLEYLEKQDGIHIIDFKTGVKSEEESSLQLPIYLLLATNLQKRPVAKASYWYLNHDKTPKEKILPEIGEAYSKIYELGKRIKLGRQIEHFKCPKGGCFACTPFERILKGEGELVGLSNYRQDIYILPE